MSKVKKKVKKRATAKKASSAEPPDSRQLLIRAAQKCFGHEGYDRTSTRDIANEAGVNISLISYHFQGKEGLLRACMEEMGAAGLETVERVLKKPTSLEDFKTRLQIFVEEYLRLNMNNSSASCLMLRELTAANPNPVVVEVAKARFTVIHEKLLEFFNDAQKQKFLASGIEVEMTVMILMGSIKHVLLSETMRKQILGLPGLLEAGEAEKVCAQITGQLLNGMLPR
jgi:AcrR family transcriptional regulator